MSLQAWAGGARGSPTRAVGSGGPRAGGGAAILIVIAGGILGNTTAGVRT